MLVAVVAVTMTVGVTVTMNPRGGAGGCSGWAIVRVIPVRVIVGMRMHSRYGPFYARCARMAKRVAYLVDILTLRSSDSVDGGLGGCQHRRDSAERVRSGVRV